MAAAKTSMVTVSVPLTEIEEAIEEINALTEAFNSFGELLSCEVKITAELSLLYQGYSWRLRITKAPE